MRDMSLPVPWSSLGKYTVHLQGIARGVWRLIREKPLGACGGMLVVMLLLAALFAPWIAPYPYDHTDVR